MKFAPDSGLRGRPFAMDHGRMASSMIRLAGSLGLVAPPPLSKGCCREKRPRRLVAIRIAEEADSIIARDSQVGRFTLLVAVGAKDGTWAYHVGNTYALLYKNCHSDVSGHSLVGISFLSGRSLSTCLLTCKQACTLRSSGHPFAPCRILWVADAFLQGFLVRPPRALPHAP
jgi:hypothetical protein